MSSQCTDTAWNTLWNKFAHAFSVVRCTICIGLRFIKGCSYLLSQNISTISCPSRCRNTCKGAAWGKSDLVFHPAFNLHTSVPLRLIEHSLFSSPERHEKLIYDPDPEVESVRTPRVCWTRGERECYRATIHLSFMIKSSVFLSSLILKLKCRFKSTQLLHFGKNRRVRVTVMKSFISSCLSLEDQMQNVPNYRKCVSHIRLEFVCNIIYSEEQ